MATKKNTSTSSNPSDIKKIRKDQLEQVKSIISMLEEQLKEATGHHKKQLKLLNSVSQGLYEEIDKLSKKAPADGVTDLVLEQMNEVIKDTKELVEDDRYVQRLSEFVAAGDNPEHRDAVVVMKQVRQGLKRFQDRLFPLVDQLRHHQETARGIEMALQLYVDGQTSVTKDELAAYNRKVPDAWLMREMGLGTIFDFSKLDKVDLANLFQLEDE